MPSIAFLHNYRPNRGIVSICSLVLGEIKGKKCWGCIQAIVQKTKQLLSKSLQLWGLATGVKLMDYCSAVEGRNQNSSTLLFVNVTWEQIFLMARKKTFHHRLNKIFESALATQVL